MSKLDDIEAVLTILTDGGYDEIVLTVDDATNLLAIAEAAQELTEIMNTFGGTPPMATWGVKRKLEGALAKLEGEAQP